MLGSKVNNLFFIFLYLISNIVTGLSRLSTVEVGRMPRPGGCPITWRWTNQFPYLTWSASKCTWTKKCRLGARFVQKSLNLTNKLIYKLFQVVNIAGDAEEDNDDKNRFGFDYMESGGRTTDGWCSAGDAFIFQDKTFNSHAKVQKYIMSKNSI